MWSPTDADGLPVMFWIYGGGLRAGSAHQPYYLGDDLASEGVVVARANYRLGAFGFLAIDELGDGWEPDAESSRVTLLDARFELVDEIRGGRCDAVTELASVRR